MCLEIQKKDRATLPTGKLTEISNIRRRSLRETRQSEYGIQRKGYDLCSLKSLKVVIRPSVLHQSTVENEEERANLVTNNPDILMRSDLS